MIKKILLIALFLSASLSFPTLYAQDISNAPLWRQALGGVIIGRPIAQVESVVAITDGSRLLSFSSQGTPLWDYSARGRLTPHLSRSREGTSYICRTNGILIAINRAGRELWQYRLRTPIIYPVLIGWDSRLFVFTETQIICMTASGNVLWSKTLEKSIALAPFLDTTGGFIIVMDDGEVQSIDPFGNLVSYQLLGGVSSAVPSAITSLYIEGWGPSILLLHSDRQLELIYPELGYGETFRGRLDLPSLPLAAVGRGDKAAVLLQDGRLALICFERRDILWLADIGISIPASVEIDISYDERGIYVLTREGASAFTADGRRLWIIRLTGTAALPVFGDDGILYSSGNDWILHAYQLEDQVRAGLRLLYGEEAEGNYGLSNPGPSSWANFPLRFEERELQARFSEIQQAIRNGYVGNREREYIAWLMETSGSFAAILHTGGRSPVQVQQRADATRLFAYIGSRETIPFLANLFINDPEAPVKAAAAYAIGKIGVDPEGIALRAFQSVISPMAISNETVLTSVAAAVGALCRFSGPPLSEAGIRLLTALSSADRPPATRRQAQQEMRSL